MPRLISRRVWGRTVLVATQTALRVRLYSGVSLFALSNRRRHDNREASTMTSGHGGPDSGQASQSLPRLPHSPSAVLAQHIQHSALLYSQCSDLSLTAFGRSYALHRIFLVQSSFFSTLLQGGFSEGASYVAPHLATSPASASSSAAPTLCLTFDDPNITRPAFEYCIAHLYGAAPQLVLPAWAIPTSSSPLSVAWPPSADTWATGPRPPASTTHQDDLRAGTREHMPATPRFLLSLLATSIYLGVPSLTSAATTLILASFTPYTISTYLRFALGKPLVGVEEARSRTEDEKSEPLWDWELEGPCWGLARIGKRISNPAEDQQDTKHTASPLRDLSALTESLIEDSEGIRSPLTSQAGPSRDDSPDVARRTSSSSIMSGQAHPRTGKRSSHSATGPLLDYGQVANRIAESCFCYLNRWGGDIAKVEMEKWAYDETALEDWLAQQCDDPREDTVLLSEVIAPYILPRGQVPARILPVVGSTGASSRSKPDSAAIAVASSPPRGKSAAGGASVSSPASVGPLPHSGPDPQWDIPVPALCIFSHPAFARAPFAVDSFLHEESKHQMQPLRRRLSTDDIEKVDIDLNDQHIATPFALASFTQSLSSTSMQSLGLSSDRLTALIASDGFFVPNELERYALARGIVMMRRAQSCLASEVDDCLRGTEDAGDDDEDADDGEEADTATYTHLFKFGIYYSHMSFGDLKRISQEAQQYAMAETQPRDDEHDSDYDSDIGSIWSPGGREGSDNDDSTDESPSQPLSSYLQSADSRSSQSTRWADGRAHRHRQRRDKRATVFQNMLAPIDTLQAALWSGNELKNHILTSTGASLDTAVSSDGPATARRGLAFAADAGSALAPEGDGGPAVPGVHSVGVGGNAGQAASAGGARITPSPGGPPDRDESFLGITSSLKHFGQAYQQATRRRTTRTSAGTTTSFASPSSRPRHAGPSSESVNSTPLRRRRSDLHGSVSGSPSTPRQSPAGVRSSTATLTAAAPALTLGGLAHSPSNSGGNPFSSSAFAKSTHSSAKSLLSNRYFSIPVDDTVRYGEHFTGLLNGSVGEARTAVATPSGPHDASVSKFDATGLAALQDAHSLPISSTGTASTAKATAAASLSAVCFGDSPAFATLENFLVGGPFSDTRRNQGNLYGLANKACRGRELGRLGAEVTHRKAALDAVLGDIANARRSNSAGEGGTSGTNPEDDIAETQKTTTAASTVSHGATQDEEETLDAGITLAKLENRKWTGFEPMRVGVEYYGIDRLDERQRLYSPSFFYAGSVWILYVQIMKKPKGMQLGVYLHRHGPTEPLPLRSAPVSDVLRFYHANSGRSDDAADGGGGDANATSDSMPQARSHAHTSSSSSFLHTNDRSPTSSRHAEGGAGGSRRGAGPPPMSTSVDAQLSASTTTATSSSATSSSLLPPGPPALPGQSPPIPYRDPRKSVRAFFSIHCYSPLGNSLTRFDSGPDRFSESQSWGWKSSSLMGVWTLPTGKREDGKSERCEGFRCVVSLGVI